MCTSGCLAGSVMEVDALCGVLYLAHSLMHVIDSDVPLSPAALARAPAPRMGHPGLRGYG